QAAKRIKDRLALVELDPKRRVRAVADDDVGTRIDCHMGKGAHEVGGVIELGLGLRRNEARLRVFMAVEVKDDPISLTPRLPDPAQIVLDIRRGAFTRDLEAR